MRPFSVVVQWFGLMLALGCTAPIESPQRGDSACSARVIIRVNETYRAVDDVVLRQIAEHQRLDFDSVTQLGDHVYRVLLRSDSEDCAGLMTRLNRDERVKYATLDERKRPH